MISDAQILARMDTRARQCARGQFNARITPQNSMPADRFLLGLALIGVASAVLQIAVIVAGAWPLTIVLAFATLLLICALTLSQAELQRHEDIVLEGNFLRVEQVSRGKLNFIGRLNCEALVIERHDCPQLGFCALRINDGATNLEVAQDLSPSERESFADAMLRALRQAGYVPHIERHARQLQPFKQAGKHETSKHP